MKRLGNESGQTLIMVALCLPVLMGFLALGADLGLMFRAKRQMQTAADAAAIAAALDYKFNGSVSSAQTVGLSAATANGVTNGVNGAVVTINIPPADGPNAGVAGFIEALVSAPNQTYFMSVLQFNSMTVGARAVAGSGPGAGCVWALAKSGVDISISGSGTISVPSCDIYDNSDSTDALAMSGSATLTANSIGIVGKYSESGSGSISPKPVMGVAPMADPLASLQFPTVTTTGCGAAQNFSGSTNHSIGPGCYNGVSNSGSGTLTFTTGNYTINGSLTTSGSGGLVFGAGQYIVTSNLSVTGSGPVSGTGVTFFTEGTTSVSGSSDLTLSAPTSGADSGLLFFQSRTDSHAISISGSSNMGLQGIIYAPDSALGFSGSGSTNIYTDLIVDSVTFSGSTAFNNYSKLNSSSVLGRIGMAE